MNNKKPKCLLPLLPGCFSAWLGENESTTTMQHKATTHISAIWAMLKWKVAPCSMASKPPCVPDSQKRWHHGKIHLLRQWVMSHVSQVHLHSCLRDGGMSEVWTGESAEENFIWEPRRNIQECKWDLCEKRDNTRKQLSPSQFTSKDLFSYQSGSVGALVYNQGHLQTILQASPNNADLNI